MTAVLERERLTKELLAHEMEQGGEVSIPSELSQEGLPLSFRYYDPIFNIMQDLISDDKRHLYNYKKRIAYELYRQNDRMISLKALLYSDKLSNPVTRLNTQAPRAPIPIHLDFNKNPHSMSLQQSNYICIDDYQEIPKLSNI